METATLTACIQASSRTPHTIPIFTFNPETDATTSPLQYSDQKDYYNGWLEKFLGSTHTQVIQKGSQPLVVITVHTPGWLARFFLNRPQRVEIRPQGFNPENLVLANTVASIFAARGYTIAPDSAFSDALSAYEAATTGVVAAVSSAKPGEQPSKPTKALRVLPIRSPAGQDAPKSVTPDPPSSTPGTPPSTSPSA
jgi:hypothetical protein